MSQAGQPESSSFAPADPGAGESLRDLTAWPDAWLVAAVRQEPPDEEALDVLAERHWRSLYGRCCLLTLHRERAADLAQDAWCRILRARTSLRPDGNFPAYLLTVATNLWRDRYRAERRAGEMAEGRLLSLEAPLVSGGEEAGALADLLPDLSTLDFAAQTRLRLDLDQALGRLPPLLRDVLVARLLTGESCADIGRRHGRTEQTVSGWVRQAVGLMRQFLGDTGEEAADGNLSTP